MNVFNDLLMTSASPVGTSMSRSEVFRQIKVFCTQDPALASAYTHAKETLRMFRRPSFYEVSTTCNLFCEGCYYFEDSDPDKDLNDGQKSLADWRRFFEAEAARGVSMAYFVGAEPALHQERLLAASDLFPQGNIGSNGTIFIHPEVPFRIGVSVWAADDETDKKLRGASAFRKALRLYKGDPRAIILFTVSAWNVHQIDDVAHLCREHGVDMTFNLFSPTHEFNNKLSSGKNDHNSKYFRESSLEDSPVLSAGALARAREAMSAALEDYPETVIYSDDFNDWLTRPGSLYELDENGVALNCGSRIVGKLEYFKTNLQSTAVKCCTPDVDCKTCRMYAGGWSTQLEPKPSDVVSATAFSRWMGMIDTIERIFTMKRSR